MSNNKEPTGTAADKAAEKEVDGLYEEWKTKLDEVITRVKADTDPARTEAIAKIVARANGDIPRVFSYFNLTHHGARYHAYLLMNSKETDTVKVAALMFIQGADKVKRGEPFETSHAAARRLTRRMSQPVDA